MFLPACNLRALKRCTSVCSFILKSYYSAVLGEALALIKSILWHLNEQNKFIHTHHVLLEASNILYKPTCCLLMKRAYNEG